MLLSATMPRSGDGAVTKAPAVSGRNETAGAAVSAGSRVLSVAVACPVVPSTSVATAIRSIRPGAAGVTTAMPLASNGTATPFAYSTMPAIAASPAAMGCTFTACPGAVTKDGVSSIRTLGAGGVSEACSTIVSLVVTWPSLAANVGV